MGLFDDVEEPENDFAPLEQGVYLGILDQVSLDLTQDPPRFSFQYNLIKGPCSCKNRKVWANFKLEGKAKYFLMQTVEKLGLEPSDFEKPEDLAAACHEKSGQDMLELYVKRTPKKDKPGEYWYNPYINGLADGAPTNFNFDDGPKPPSGVGIGDDIPF